MKLSEMKTILSERGLMLTKSLGQNFLHDGNQLGKIADAAELVKSDSVLEIGPGLGPLTERLIERAGRVVAIEKDARLIPILRERFAEKEQLELIHADALDWLKASTWDWTGWKLVANLPYSVGTPILVELALKPRPPEWLVVTLQSEVIRRMFAQAGHADYGLLTVLIRMRYEPVGVFKIPASCFFPEPDVESSCGALRLLKEPLVTNTELADFVTMAKLAFSQRRKMMAKLLKQRWSPEVIADAFESVGIPMNARAESVSVELLVRLFRTLNQTSKST